MRRRAFCGSIGAFLAAPAAFGQPAATRRIAILEQSDRATSDAFWRIFDVRLRELGYLEGRNINIDRRWAGGPEDRLPELAQELLAGKPELVLVTGTTTTRVFMRLTTTIPIVMVGVADPVATGLVASLAHPGGNVTGLSFLLGGVAVKRMDLLREIVPGARRFGLLGTANPGVLAVLKQLQAAAQPSGLEVRLLEAGDAPTITRTFEKLGAEPVDALIIATALRTHYSQIVELAARFRIPASFAHKEPLEAGALTVYAPERDALYKRAADYVHRILQGAKPAELPIEQPTEFWLGVNMRTARTLGLKIPQSILVRADRVIE